MKLDLLRVFTGAESMDGYDDENTYLSEDTEQHLEEPLSHPEEADSVEFEDAYDEFGTPEDVAEEVANDGFTVDAYQPDVLEDEYTPEATIEENIESIPDEFSTDENQAESSISDILEDNTGVSLNEEGLANVGQYNTIEENEEIFEQEGIAGYDIYDENGFDREDAVETDSTEDAVETDSPVEELGFVEEGSSFVEDVDLSEYEQATEEFENEHAEELGSDELGSEESFDDGDVVEVSTDETEIQDEIQEEREESGEEMETSSADEEDFEEDFSNDEGAEEVPEEDVPEEEVSEEETEEEDAE
ncbi:MAG: hypothetical protein ACRCX2_39015 [Paraclostridium sp.]